MSAAEADREWTLRATEILVEVAGRYGRSIAYADLGAEVQRRSGIVTDRDLENWLDAVLSEVGRRCAEAGQPPLNVLVDDGADSVAESVRASVYSAYGAKMPKARVSRASQGGTARTSRASQSGTARANRASQGGAAGRTSPAGERSPRTSAPTTRRTVKPEERRRPVCPTCFVELPATGICDDCE